MDVFGYKLVINLNITSGMFFDSAERSTGRQERNLGVRNFFSGSVDVWVSTPHTVTARAGGYANVREVEPRGV